MHWLVGVQLTSLYAVGEVWIVGFLVALGPMLALTFLAADLSLRLVERPLLGLRHRRARDAASALSVPVGAQRALAAQPTTPE